MIDPKSLEIDLSQLKNTATPSEMQTMADSGMLSEIFKNLTPTQIAEMFPSYYDDPLPNISGFEAASSGAPNAPNLASSSDLSSSPKKNRTSNASAEPTPEENRVLKEWQDRGIIKRPPTVKPMGAGTYRPVYEGIDNDLADRDLINIIGREARNTNESIDAVINNMMNRLGSPSYGNPNSLSEVAKQRGQYESWKFLQSGRFKPVDDAHANRIRERLNLIASGALPDTTQGANEFRATSYVTGSGRNKTFARNARKSGAPDIGGNTFADTGYKPGPYAAFENPEVPALDTKRQAGAPITGFFGGLGSSMFNTMSGHAQKAEEMGYTVLTSSTTGGYNDDDANAMADQILENRKNNEPIILNGHSAGGYFATRVAAALKQKGVTEGVTLNLFDPAQMANSLVIPDNVSQANILQGNGTGIAGGANMVSDWMMRVENPDKTEIMKRRVNASHVDLAATQEAEQLMFGQMEQKKQRANMSVAPLSPPSEALQSIYAENPGMEEFIRKMHKTASKAGMELNPEILVDNPQHVKWVQSQMKVNDPIELAMATDPSYSPLVVMNNKGTRNQPITPQLTEALEWVAQDIQTIHGKKVVPEVISGGQDAHGHGTRRVTNKNGKVTVNHDLGHAADVKWRVLDENGKWDGKTYLDYDKEEDQEVFHTIVEKSRTYGMQGIGMGRNASPGVKKYMNSQTIHLGTLRRDDLNEAYANQPQGAPARGSATTIYSGDKATRAAYARGAKAAESITPEYVDKRREAKKVTVQPETEVKIEPEAKSKSEEVPDIGTLGKKKTQVDVAPETPVEDLFEGTETHIPIKAESALVTQDQSGNQKVYRMGDRGVQENVKVSVESKYNPNTLLSRSIESGKTPMSVESNGSTMQQTASKFNPASPVMTPAIHRTGYPQSPTDKRAFANAKLGEPDNLNSIFSRGSVLRYS